MIRLIRSASRSIPLCCIFIVVFISSISLSTFAQSDDDSSSIDNSIILPSFTEDLLSISPSLTYSSSLDRSTTSQLITTPTPSTLLPCTDSTITQQLPPGALDSLAQSLSIPLSSHKCLVIDASDNDISEQLDRIENNTLVLLKQYNPVTPSLTSSSTQVLEPSVTPLDSEKQFRRLMVSRIQVMPEHSWIIGVNLHTLGHPVQIETTAPFNGKHWLEIGNSSQQAINIGLSGLAHIDFRAPIDFSDNSIDSILYMRCVHGQFHVLNNTFYLDRRAALYYQCFANIDGNLSSLVFSNNNVNGFNLNVATQTQAEDPRSSKEGLFVELPFITNNTSAVQISDSQFSGNMETGVEVTVGASSKATITQVSVNKDGQGVVNKGLQLHIRGKTNTATYTVESSYFHGIEAVELLGSMHSMFSNNTLNGNQAMVQRRQHLDYSGSEASDFGTLTFLPSSTANQWDGEGSPYAYLQPYEGILEFTGHEDPSVYPTDPEVSSSVILPPPSNTPLSSPSSGASSVFSYSVIGVLIMSALSLAL